MHSLSLLCEENASPIGEQLSLLASPSQEKKERNQEERKVIGETEERRDDYFLLHAHLFLSQILARIPFNVLHQMT